jgi:hypothetical protein
MPEREFFDMFRICNVNLRVHSKGACALIGAIFTFPNQMSPTMCPYRGNFYFPKSNEPNNVPARIAIVCGVVCVAALVIIPLCNNRRGDKGGAG